MSKHQFPGQGLLHFPSYLTDNEKKKILEYLATRHPIWEMRFSKHNPPPAGQANRQLLRPVYWLGNWQFACLNYYHPPKGIHHRCVEAEPFPPVLETLIEKIEDLVHGHFPKKDIPTEWHLNTCLINYYGCRLTNGKKEDVARVGEHKDFEPGPVASLSLGERALFQFVTSPAKQARSHVVLQQWLGDGDLQIFGSDRFKKQLFHRVQRVEKKLGTYFSVNTEPFETRRINFTFRYVPIEHIQPYQKFPTPLKEDVAPYLQKLAAHSDFFKGALAHQTTSE